MRVIHLNISKKNDPMTGVKRYEDEIYSNIKKLDNDIVLTRTQRNDNKFLGSVLASWIFTYKFNNADIVHATFQGIAPALYFRPSFSIKRNTLFLATVHDLIPILYPSAITNLSAKSQLLLTLRALRKADNIISISEFSKKEMVRICNIKNDKIHVVYQGVDHFKYRPMDREESKKKFNLDLNEKHILVVASNLEHKRMDLAKRIHDKIRISRPDVKMLKVGYGEALDGEGIINLGWISEEDMPILFNAADAYLHTSEYEGFGLPILEAMACGIPVVVSQRASIPEIVGDCGSMVDLAADDCVDRFVEELLEAIDKEIDETEIERSKRFSWENTAKRTVEVYKWISS